MANSIADNDFVPDAPVRHVEWDFDSVPESQLKACLIWEMAHESSTISQNARRLRLQPFTRPTRHDGTLGRSVKNSAKVRAQARQELKRIPECSEEVMLAMNDAHTRESEFYGKVLLFGGDQTLHWLEIPSETRELWSKEADQWTLHPKCEPAYLCDLETLWNKYASELTELRAVEKPDDDTVECHLYSTKTEPVDTSLEDDRTDSPLGHRLTTALTIDFKRFTDAEITMAFSDWIKSVRPCPAPTRRGKKHNDHRAALDGLGIMRLLQWHRIRDQDFPAKFKRRGARACYKARQLAFQKFRQIFPFLPPDEKPSAWTTWPETERMCQQIEREMETLETSVKTR